MRRPLHHHVKSVLAGVILAAGVGAVSAEAKPADFTIEQVMSAPFPSSLAAAPQGGRVAWVYDANGTRNIWVAEPAAGGGYTAKQVTAYTGDEGWDVGQVTWDPAGK